MPHATTDCVKVNGPGYLELHHPGKIARSVQSNRGNRPTGQGNTPRTLGLQGRTANLSKIPVQLKRGSAATVFAEPAGRCKAAALQKISKFVEKRGILARVQEKRIASKSSIGE